MIPLLSAQTSGTPSISTYVTTSGSMYILSTLTTNSTQASGITPPFPKPSSLPAPQLVPLPARGSSSSGSHSHTHSSPPSSAPSASFSSGLTSISSSRQSSLSSASPTSVGQ
ncbi:hypothetical protein PAXRUDRAFT_20243 [Paxillus rubicundulus Ve08.2h10]|uniref:Uncharacterized protein n=1 Tax=Paxillus rubicundulus Ve08.2h10 TaxID=930991 RepID=A0A0D0DA52_9AGAM|nr:hypothetical protein PAXRUDRAFT_20243 [Paxillus rubicundulus Ve08.2h10]